MTPGECPYERTTIRMGRLKTCCTVKGHDIWTECREWGKCNWDGYQEPDWSELEQDDSECEANESECEPTASETERTESESEQMTLW